ncbi:hypothetical protein [Paenibacillus agricola]|uniref:Transposase n=1 Tax=Paenibacillus agricola TaxID=2716264 RepID=A0ABX0J9B3_9BACL|nr:hypothetical protein [Paenibacillus agricola]NHN32747.1 hypothetical protein [Paenibacillus agricola]
MKRVQYDLNFKMEIIRKGKEIGNFTAVAGSMNWIPRWSCGGPKNPNGTGTPMDIPRG